MRFILACSTVRHYIGTPQVCQASMRARLLPGMVYDGAVDIQRSLGDNVCRKPRKDSGAMGGIAMILILSDSHDAHANVVQRRLLDRGQSPFRLNLDVASLVDTQITMDYGSGWVLHHGGTELRQPDVSAVWTRRAFVELMLEEQECRDADFLIWKGEWNKTLLGLYMTLDGVPWLSPVRESLRAENKFLQRKIASQIGLRVPDQIVSNDRTALASFAMHNDHVALKLHNQELRGRRYIRVCM